MNSKAEQIKSEETELAVLKKQRDDAGWDDDSVKKLTSLRQQIVQLQNQADALELVESGVVVLDARINCREQLIEHLKKQTA